MQNMFKTILLLLIVVRGLLVITLGSYSQQSILRAINYYTKNLVSYDIEFKEFTFLDNISEIVIQEQPDVVIDMSNKLNVQYILSSMAAERQFLYFSPELKKINEHCIELLPQTKSKVKVLNKMIEYLQ